MNKIVKCRICGEPFWDNPEMEKREGTGEVCPECIRKADKKMDIKELS